MYHLCDIWGLIFEEIKKINNGILAFNNGGEIEVLSDVFISNLNKLNIMFSPSFIYKDEKANANIAGELMNGKVSVRRGGCSVYRAILERIQSSIATNGLVEEAEHLAEVIKYSIKAKEYFDQKNIKRNVLNKSEIEYIEVDNDLENLQYTIQQILKTNFKSEFYSASECYPEDVWAQFAWIIYNILLNMDYSNAKRDFGYITSSADKISSVLGTYTDSEDDDIISSLSSEQVPEIKSFFDMCKLGYTPLKISQALVENDNVLYQLEDGHKNEGSPSLWASFIEAYPETFAYLVYEKKIIGNYSLVTLSDKQIDDLLVGALNENEFALEKNESIVFPGIYTLYLLNFSVNIGWNTVENYNKLWSALMRQIEKYAQQGIFFNSIYVNTFREDHRALYRNLGFEYVVDNKSLGKVYELKNFPQNLRWKNKEILTKLYQKSK